MLDNLSAHKTEAVEQFLINHPKVWFHFTPTYSSWLNQVELWFAKIERDVIARGVFTSVGDLRRKLMRYIRAYAEHGALSAGPTPIPNGGLSLRESLGRPTSSGSQTSDSICMSCHASGVLVQHAEAFRGKCDQDYSMKSRRK